MKCTSVTISNNRIIMVMNEDVDDMWSKHIANRLGGIIHDQPEWRLDRYYYTSSNDWWIHINANEVMIDQRYPSPGLMVSIAKIILWSLMLENENTIWNIHEALEWCKYETDNTV